MNGCRVTHPKQSDEKILSHITPICDFNTRSEKRIKVTRNKPILYTSVENAPVKDIAS